MTAFDGLKVCVACNPAHQFDGPACKTAAARHRNRQTLKEQQTIDKIVELMGRIDEALQPTGGHK